MTKSNKTLTSVNNTFTRLLPALFIATIMAFILTNVNTPEAQAATKTSHHHTHHAHRNHHKHHTNNTFQAPTTITPVSSTCTQTNSDNWDVTVTWQVTGGRYANLGNPGINDNPIEGDNVTNGQARLINSTEHYHTYPGASTSTPFMFSQLIAPIGQANDVTKMVNIEQWLPVTFTC